MNKEKIRVGVIGLGAIGPSHIFALNHTEDAELAAVCDVRPEAAKEAGDEHGVPSFTSVDDMLAADLIDAATLCVPSGFHLEPSLKVLEAGKHILIEKPIEITTERIDKLIAAADQNGVMIAGVFQSRFGSAVQKLKELVDDGLLGDIYSGSAYTKRYRTQEYYDSGGWRGTWAVDGGGCLMNQGIHCIDLFVWFMGKVDEVIAITETVGRDVEVETLAVALLRFANGARGVIQATTLAYPELPRRIEIFGERGTFVFDGGRLQHMELIDPTPDERAIREELLATYGLAASTAPPSEKQPKTPPGTPVPAVDMGHIPVMADFVAAIREDRPPLADGREARRAVELITAIYESGRNHGKPVRLRS